MPVIARNLLESIRLLANVCRVCSPTSVSTASRPTSSAAKQYAESIAVDRHRRSTRTSATRRSGEIIKESIKTGRSIRELVLEAGLMTDEELDRALDVLAMTRGGIVR